MKDKQLLTYMFIWVMVHLSLGCASWVVWMMATNLLVGRGDLLSCMVVIGFTFVCGRWAQILLYKAKEATSK